MMRNAGPILAGSVAALIAASSGARAADLSRAEQRQLGNGLEIVVIPDHRAPVVTHVVAYKSGAADDPAGASGIAHFVEHLMYKSTSTMPGGGYARALSRLGGRENAETSHDTTIFHQRFPKDGLARVMALEADRMANLRFDAEEVRRERQVIIEERRQRIELSPINLLNEQMTAEMLAAHPYGQPVLGWPQEMSRLTREDAKAFYGRHYAPDNAVVVVQGDVEPDDVFRMAMRSYGVIPASGSARHRRREAPIPHGGRTIERVDQRVASTSVVRLTFVAELGSASRPDTETLEIMMRILAQGDTSRLHSRLVRRDGLALATEGGVSKARDGSRLALYAIAVPGATAAALRAAMDDEIAALAMTGIGDDELDSARSVVAAADVYDGDNQLTSAMQVARAIADGHTITDLQQRSRRLESVTRDDVRRAAARFLTADRLITGILRPAAAANEPAVEAAR